MKEKPQLAIEGYDPVAYFTENRAVQGLERHQHVHEGKTFWFTSAANQKAFSADPDKYAPQYGGHCAFAMSLGKADAPAGSPKSWKIVDGRLYLALNPVARFLMGILPNRIQRANEYWGDFAGATGARH